MKISKFVLNPKWAAPFLCVAALSAFASGFGPERAIAPVDNPDALSSRQPLERNAFRLDQTAPRQLTLKVQPWKDAFWGLSWGLIANRYADRGYVSQRSWSSRHDYILAHPAYEILAGSDPQSRFEKIDALSPAEKYDMLVGDSSWTLTQSQWAEGERFLRAGAMANWMGICEGSAAASVLYPEPRHSVDLPGPQGDWIRFHILDIKALSSLLWSSYNAQVPMSGSRCAGGESEESCFNSNPASVHIAVLNMVGRRLQPVFVNRVPKDEVWNVPIISYEVSYFKVSGFWHSHESEIKNALVSVDEAGNSALRAPGTRFVVGVELKVQYANGFEWVRDSVRQAKIVDAKYKYELELDQSGQILGGEWRGGAHPDFMWAVEPGFRPLSVGDHQLGDVAWDGQAIPAGWLSAIRLSSSRNQPLEVIVRKLVELAQ